MPAANCFCIVRCHQVLMYNCLDVLSLACVACQGAFEMMFSELMMVAAMQDVTVIVLLISGVVSTVLGLALEGQGGDSWIEVTANSLAGSAVRVAKGLLCSRSGDIFWLHGAHACTVCCVGCGHHGSGRSGGPGDSGQQLSEGAAVSCLEPDQ